MRCSSALPPTTRASIVSMLTVFNQYPKPYPLNEGVMQPRAADEHARQRGGRACCRRRRRRRPAPAGLVHRRLAACTKWGDTRGSGDWQVRNRRDRERGRCPRRQQWRGGGRLQGARADAGCAVLRSCASLFTHPPLQTFDFCLHKFITIGKRPTHFLAFIGCTSQHEPGLRAEHQDGLCYLGVIGSTAAALEGLDSSARAERLIVL